LGWGLTWARSCLLLVIFLLLIDVFAGRGVLLIVVLLVILDGGSLTHSGLHDIINCQL
jgi:hypothetical protein